MKGKQTDEEQKNEEIKKPNGPEDGLEIIEESKEESIIEDKKGNDRVEEGEKNAMVNEHSSQTISPQKSQEVQKSMKNLDENTDNQNSSRNNPPATSERTVLTEVNPAVLDQNNSINRGDQTVSDINSEKSDLESEDDSEDSEEEKGDSVSFSSAQSEVSMEINKKIQKRNSSFVKGQSNKRASIVDASLKASRLLKMVQGASTRRKNGPSFGKSVVRKMAPKTIFVSSRNYKPEYEFDPFTDEGAIQRTVFHSKKEMVINDQKNIWQRNTNGPKKGNKNTVIFRHLNKEIYNYVRTVIKANNSNDKEQFGKIVLEFEEEQPPPPPPPIPPVEEEAKIELEKKTEAENGQEAGSRRSSAEKKHRESQEKAEYVVLNPEEDPLLLNPPSPPKKRGSKEAPEEVKEEPKKERKKSRAQVAAMRMSNWNSRESKSEFQGLKIDKLVNPGIEVRKYSKGMIKKTLMCLFKLNEDASTIFIQSRKSGEDKKPKHVISMDKITKIHKTRSTANFQRYKIKSENCFSIEFEGKVVDLEAMNEADYEVIMNFFKFIE